MGSEWRNVATDPTIYNSGITGVSFLVEMRIIVRFTILTVSVLRDQPTWPFFMHRVTFACTPALYSSKSRSWTVKYSSNMATQDYSRLNRTASVTELSSPLLCRISFAPKATCWDFHLHALSSLWFSTWVEKTSNWALFFMNFHPTDRFWPNSDFT